MSAAAEPQEAAMEVFILFAYQAIRVPWELTYCFT